MNSLVPAVVERFDLGDVNTARTQAMVGSTNRLWRLQTDLGDFVIKEFSYDAPADLQRRERAAAFERHVYESRTVLLPEPVATGDGAFVVSLPGSRGDDRGVRVHRWLDGDRIGPRDDAFLATAGSSLHAIQCAGAAWSTESTGSIRWWDVDPLVVVDRLHESHLSVLVRDAGSVIADGLAVIEAAEAADGPWLYSHCDHKPDNALDVGG